MKRELFGKEISQKSQSEYFSATDLMRAGNSWRIVNGFQPIDMSKWFMQTGVKEFMSELEKEVGQKVKISARGRGQHTWVHPFLFIDMALAINPKLKIEVYGWLYDELLKHRNSSGDSYKKMTGALFINTRRKDNFTRYIQDVARNIKHECDVIDWNKATDLQLKTRDKMHENIALLCDVLKNNEDAVRIGIIKAKESK
jgi:hypothetical protein